jgi:regulatory protein
MRQPVEKGSPDPDGTPRSGGRITAIEPQKHHPERSNVHLDGAFRFALAQELVFREGLRVGELLSPARIEELESEDLRWKAREAALNLLSYRPRTAAELRRRLARKEYPEPVVEACVEELLEKGLVDDGAFAESFIRDRVRFRPRGRRRLVQELRAKGVDPETAQEAIGEVMEREETSELELAREALRKWSRRPGEDPRKAKQRLYGFLARRGFGGDTLRQILDEVELG